MKNYYDILGIDINSSKVDIKKAYFKLVRVYSPEKNPEEFGKIRKAYEVLIDEKSRAEYDAITQYGEEIREYRQIAEKAMEEHDYKLAIKTYKKILLIEPSSSSAKNELGLALLEDDKVDESINQFLELLDLYPKNSTFLSNLAHAYWYKGDFINTEKYFQEAYKLYPINMQIVSNLVDVYIENKRYSTAISFLEDCIKQEVIHVSEEYLYYFEMLEVYIFDERVNNLDNIINIIKSKIIDEESKQSIGWKFGQVAYKFLQKNMYDIAEKLSYEGKNILPDNEDIINLYEECKGKNIYYKLNDDERIIGPIKGPVYYFLYGSEYEKDEYEDTIRKNTQAINSYLTYEHSINVIESIEILRNEYPRLYNYKKDMYDNIYTIASEKDNIYNEFKEFDESISESNGLRRLIHLSISDYLSNEERKEYFDNILDEIEHENKNKVYKCLNVIKTNYKLLYRLNEYILDELEKVTKSIIQENEKKLNVLPRRELNINEDKCNSSKAAKIEEGNSKINSKNTWFSTKEKIILGLASLFIILIISIDISATEDSYYSEQEYESTEEYYDDSDESSSDEYNRSDDENNNYDSYDADANWQNDSSNLTVDYHYADTETTDLYYSINTEAYYDYSKAEQYEQELENKGINAVVYEEDNIYKVRAGTAYTYEEAQEIEQELNNRSVDTYILAYDYDVQRVINYIEASYLDEAYGIDIEQFDSAYEDLKLKIGDKPGYAGYVKKLDELYNEVHK